MQAVFILHFPNIPFTMHTLLKVQVISLALILVLASCNKEIGGEGNEYDPAVSKTLKDEAYGAGAPQKADIYLPANRGATTPLLVFLHGGSWAEGNKSDLDEVMTLIRAQWPEAALVNMNYTLANNTAATLHPAQMNDIGKLLEYIESKKTLWQVGGKWAITGVSAGAHLGLLYSYAYNTGSKVKAVVSVVGPTDFSDPFYTTNPIFQAVATNYLGKSWLQDPDLHRSVSPALKVTTAAPPTFMAYGALDALVPLSNATTLRNKLQTLGITHTYIEYPTEGHEFSPAAINNLVPQVVNFLKTNL